MRYQQSRPPNSPPTPRPAPQPREPDDGPSAAGATPGPADPRRTPPGGFGRAGGSGGLLGPDPTGRAVPPWPGRPVPGGAGPEGAGPGQVDPGRTIAGPAQTVAGPGQTVAGHGRTVAGPRQALAGPGQAGLGHAGRGPAELGVRTPPGGQQPTRPGPHQFTPVAGAATVASPPGKTEDTKAGKAEFNVPKVIAGAGAAATTAVVGSSFGATGTVVGAALASVVTAVATTTFQRSLETTTRTVRSRLVKMRKIDPAAAPTAVLAVPTQRTGSPSPQVQLDATMVAPSEAAPRRARFTPRRIAVMAALALAVFGLGLFVVTGIEWIKGSPLSGGTSGTSVGRVLQPAAGPAETATEQPAGGAESSEEATPTETATPTPTPTPRRGPGVGSERTSAPPPTSSAPTSEDGLLPRIGPDAGGADSSGG